MKIVRILGVVMCLMAHTLVGLWGRWAGPEDMVYKVTNFDVTVNVKKDGSSDKDIILEYEVLKENGRYSFAQYALEYNGDNETLNIVEAKTIYQGKEYVVDKELIEDKSVASNPQGFDDLRRVTIAFPKVEIGAKVYIHFKRSVQRSELENYFSTALYFGKHAWFEKAKVRINSDIPLYYVANDPHKVLSLKTSGQEGKDTFKYIEIALTKPVLQAVVSEGDGGELLMVPNADMFTWVSISSLNDWKSFAQLETQNYAKVYSEALPKTFEDIMNAAKQMKTEVDQINTVTSLLNDRIHYMGDRRTIKGRFVPRDLETIAQRQLGDCKDFSASAAAILTKMGYKAHIALVWRGVETDRSGRMLPSSFLFNHVMLKVVSPSGKIYWIDPTNFVSMAGGVFGDIAGKRALVLDTENSLYEDVAKIDPNHSRVELYKTLEVLDKYRVKNNSKLLMQGETAARHTGKGLFVAKGELDNFAYRMLSGAELENTQKLGVKVPELKTRVVEAIPVEATFVQDNLLVLSNAGTAMNLTYQAGLIGEFLNISDAHASDILFNNVFSEKVVVLIKNIQPKNTSALNKVIESPWMRIGRTLTQTDAGLEVMYECVIKKDIIRNIELQGSEFKQFKKALKEYFMDVYLVF